MLFSQNIMISVALQIRSGSFFLDPNITDDGGKIGQPIGSLTVRPEKGSVSIYC